MAALFGHIERFNPKTEIFSECVERLGFYFEANSVADIKKKKAIFLTLIGPSQLLTFQNWVARVAVATEGIWGLGRRGEGI